MYGVMGEGLHKKGWTEMAACFGGRNASNDDDNAGVLRQLMGDVTTPCQRNGNIICASRITHTDSGNV
jgi:hypothetical protein